MTHQGLKTLLYNPLYGGHTLHEWFSGVPATWWAGQPAKMLPTDWHVRCLDTKCHENSEMSFLGCTFDWDVYKRQAFIPRDTAQAS